MGRPRDRLELQFYNEHSRNSPLWGIPSLMSNWEYRFPAFLESSVPGENLRLSCASILPNSLQFYSPLPHPTQKILDSVKHRYLSKIADFECRDRPVDWGTQGGVNCNVICCSTGSDCTADCYSHLFTRSYILPAPCFIVLALVFLLRWMVKRIHSLQ